MMRALMSREELDAAREMERRRKRDEFAKAALAGLCAGVLVLSKKEAEQIGKNAYTLADAMMEARTS